MTYTWANEEEKKFFKAILRRNTQKKYRDAHKEESKEYNKKYYEAHKKPKQPKDMEAIKQMLLATL